MNTTYANPFRRLLAYWIDITFCMRCSLVFSLV